MSCNKIWDGTDFTRCFQERYLSNFSMALVIILSSYLILSRSIYFYRDRRSRPPISEDLLTSRAGDIHLAKLESSVILSALGANVLDTPSSRRLEADEAIQAIERFNQTSKKRLSFWDRVGWWIGVVGGLAYMGVGIAGAIATHRLKELTFPIFIGVVAFLPSSPLPTFLSFHLLVSLLQLRTDFINGNRSAMYILPTAIELALWVLVICLPYTAPMDDFLEGARSQAALSRAMYTCFVPFLWKHLWKTIQLEDIPALREDDSSAAALAAFRANQAYWDKVHAEKHNGEKRQRDLAWNLFRFFAPQLIQQSTWACFFIFIQYLPPIGLRLLLQFVSDRNKGEQPTHVAYVYVVMMAGGQLLGSTTYAQCLRLGRRMTIRVRAIIIAEVYTKALRRRDITGVTKKTSIDKEGNTVVEESEGANDGKIANLVSADAFNISEIAGYTFFLVSSPLAVILNSILLFNALGVSALAGIAVIILLIPLQGLLAKWYAIVQKRSMAATDARLESVTEVIAFIKLIKFNAWETKFFTRMSSTRNHELKVLAQKFAIAVAQQVVIWGTPVIVAAGAFAVHSVWLGRPLTADRAFASLILFNMLRDPLALFLDTYNRRLQAYTSCSRIQAYLDEPDTLKYSQLSQAGEGDPRIGFRNAHVGYSSDEDAQTAEFEPFSLGPLNLSFPTGEMSIVVGPVGCGKTTLIMSLLGETMLLEGKIFMPDDRANRDICPMDPATGFSDTIAYCSQTPWLMGASIRDNITFGSIWDETKYNDVIEACALRRDLEIFDLGDETEVGEKGTTCSGGQKARIALARALYSNAATIILDDVLSAVDAQTARHIYINCLQGPLMKGRTVILVTHAVSLVAPAASYVVMLDAGRVVASGTPSDLIAKGALEITEEVDFSASNSSTLAPDSPNDIIEENLDSLDGEAAAEHQKADDKKANPDPTLDKRLVAAETQSQGSVGLETYMLYFGSMGGLNFWIILWTILISAQLLQIANNAWIKDWANSESASPKEVIRAYAATMVTGHSTMWYLGIYCALSAVYMLAVAGRVGVSYAGSLYASKDLYDRLLKRILGAKMRFFDSTPSGRIINRLSKDMFSIDTEAGEILMYLLNCALSLITALLVIVWVTPAFFFALVLIVGLYWFLGVLYLATNREIKRYDSVTRSPIFISFQEVLVGMSTIRSYGDSARFTRKLFDELDQNTRCFWYLWQTNRVLHICSNLAGAFVTISASAFALRNRSMDAGAVGLSITYALSFTEFTLWIVRMYAACEMSMNSVERVGEYLDLEVEEESHRKGIEPPAYWPSRDGSVIVENLTCKYAPQLDPVLRGVSFEIAPREKIGICGRTASGKSTLALSFFRFLHQESGSITIDGLDISRISLPTLRSRLTILPQEAQLFSGTVRDNLDPFNEHEDAEIWDALSRCGLSGKTPGPSRAPTRPASRHPSRPVSRIASRADLRASKGQTNNDEETPAAATISSIPAKENDLRQMLLRKDIGGLANAGEGGVGDGVLPAAVDMKAPLIDVETDDLDEIHEVEVEERVTIRSLDEQVAVGGKNFSQGQRQLLALARGLLKLKTSSFLIMDESTANLDHATDQTIQHVLRTSLQDTQMLVIAHRLMTVCGLDKILVLDHGKVIEFGTPWELLQNENGSFRNLCKQSGEEAQLIELARSVHEEKMSGVIA